ncbi:UPF0236 family transposase-like protein [Spiroplasma endosymbiont of Amphimallon solstitiale]|uniref:UPF0236 family transposase-like protein n=1 Tax=Spiroplasma endosymbiont of Amphimallon solstitiale TaxID=3066288 RepID=UPI00313B865C
MLGVKKSIERCWKIFNFQNYLNNKINDIKSYFVKEVEDWDENFFQNRTAEEKERYKVSKKRNRTVNTEIGFVTFNRRIYWDNIEKRTRYFTDEEFNIEKRARVMKDLKLKILSNLINNLITKKTYTHIQAEYEYTYFSFNYVEKYGWPKIIHQFTLKILFLIKNLLKVTLFSVKIL